MRVRMMQELCTGHTDSGRPQSSPHRYNIVQDNFNIYTAHFFYEVYRLLLD